MENQMQKIIEDFDKFLAQKKLFFEATVIGGAALNILQISDRFTTDIDCLIPKIPEEIKDASYEFRLEFPKYNLVDEWLNNGPDQLISDLPAGWQARTSKAFEGTHLKIYILGRADFLKTKLFAFCDRTNPDFEDLLLLKPTRQELLESIEWVKKRDANPKWPEHVEALFKKLQEALYG